MLVGQLRRHKSPFVRPTASGRMALSAAVLSMGTASSPGNVVSAGQWLNAQSMALAVAAALTRRWCCVVSQGGVSGAFAPGAWAKKMGVWIADPLDTFTATSYDQVGINNIPCRFNGKPKNPMETTI